jgi:uroporphyrinogen decarboxylase
MGLFERKQKDHKEQLPVWFMRQAGRYHAHYQNIRKDHQFMEMCKNPELACEITMGPIEDFDFDAAILFSDLLFPLEHLGLGLTYQPGPTLAKTLDNKNDATSLKEIAPANEYYQFQKKAVELLKGTLPQDKTLIGFVGAPFTLYTYACEGSHAGQLKSSKVGLYDGKYQAFYEKLYPGLLEEMRVQAQGGIDVISLFDTAAGELSPEDYQRFIVPCLKQITAEFKKSYPNIKILYYSKHTHMDHLRRLEDPNIDILGLDWRHNFVEGYKELSDHYYVQGNIDPIWLHLPWNELVDNVDQLWKTMQDCGKPLNKWIFGLGHGVTVQTPEDNVRDLVKHIHQNYWY